MVPISLTNLQMELSTNLLMELLTNLLMDLKKKYNNE